MKKRGKELIYKNWKEVLSATLLAATSGGERTLVLGCTHFSRFRQTIEDILGARAVNSAFVGAEILAKETMPSHSCGGTIYLEP